MGSIWGTKAVQRPGRWPYSKKSAWQVNHSQWIAFPLWDRSGSREIPTCWFQMTFAHTRQKKRSGLWDIHVTSLISPGLWDIHGISLTSLAIGLYLGFYPFMFPPPPRWWNNHLLAHMCSTLGFPAGLDSKESSCNSGDLGLIPGSGRSLEKRMATHSSILAWKIPWKEETGRL